MSEKIRVIVGDEEREFNNIKQALNYLVLATHDDLNACVRELCGNVESLDHCPYTDDCNLCLSLLGDVSKCIKLLRAKRE